MKVRTAIIFLAVLLVSCTSAVAPVSTKTSAPPMPTSTRIVMPTVTPSPMPIQPTFAVITPDAIQIERWKEYQTALARKFIPTLPTDEVLCEWEILGQSNQEVYVWAVCTSTVPVGVINGGFLKGEEPAVIRLDADGSVLDIEFPGAGTDYGPDIRRLFPPDVQEKIFNQLIDYGQLLDHLEWRRAHLEVPPLIVLLATQTP